MRKILQVSLLLFSVVLTSWATDTIHLRGCRVGKPNPNTIRHRAPLLANGENPYIGNRHQLVVLASFQDQDFAEDRETTLRTWDMIFNAENYNEDSFVGSVHDFFLTQSYGMFNLTFDPVFVELPDNRHKYRSTATHDEYSQYMVDDIVDALQTLDIDWEQYDWDGDSYIDQLMIIYAGMGMNAGGGSESIWPHQWWLSQHLNIDTDDPDDYRDYRTVTAGGKEYYIDSYCCVQEFVNSKKVKSSFGTICHEYSHCLGLPDFYFASTSILGDWDLMDNGSYNGLGFRPCNYSAQERMLMGWLTPIELSTPTSIAQMAALSDEPAAYIVRNDAAEGEYYIIENRQQKGWDENLPGSGILVFHIDYDEDVWKGSTEYVNTSTRKRYSIFPANNKTSISSSSGWAYPYIVADSHGNDSVANNQLTDTSKPAAKLNQANTKGEMVMSKPITQMSIDDNGLASFLFMNGDASGVGLTPWTEPSTGRTASSALGNSHTPAYRLDGTPATPRSRGIIIVGGKKQLINEK